MGLLAKIKQALKPKENKKKKNVKTYTDNPLLKTKKKETSSTKKTAPKSLGGTLPTGKGRLDEVVKKKTTEKKTTTKTTTKTTDKKTLPKGPIKGTIPAGKDRIQENLKKKAEEKNPFKPEYSLETAKKLFNGSPENRAKNLGVDYQGKGSNTYNGNRSKIEKATKTKPNTKGDSPYQKYQANTVYNYYEEAKKAYDRGDIARGNLYVRKAQEHEEKYQTSKNAPKADPLTGNEALLLQTLSRSGSPEFTQKGLTSAQQEYANGDKTAEYGNIGGKLASNYKHDIDTAPFAQGVINGLSWVPVSRVVKNSSGVDDLNLEGDKTGFYTAGKMTGMAAQALGTGGVIKAASNLGRGVRGLINAGVDSVQNVVDAVDTADIQREKGLEIPDYINVSNVAEAKNGTTMKRGTEPGKKAEDAKMIPVSIDRWNNDLVSQAWNRAEELGQDPIFGTDKNGRLHYSFTKEGLASILEYYNTFKNPTYSLESTGREYVDSDVLRIGRNIAINTGLSFAGGMIGKGGKQTLKNTEKVAPKTAEEVTESVAPKVDIEPKVKPKTEAKTKPKTEAPKVKTAADETVVKNEGKTLPKAETKNTEYKIKQSEFTKNVNKAKEGDTVYKFKDGSEIKLESKVYNGKDGYDNFYTVVKSDGTKVENVLKEDLANTLKADSTMQTLKPKADLPKVKEIKEVNNITDAINSKGFKNKLDNATEGTVLAKTKEGREIKYAGLDENGNDLFTVVRNGKTEAEEVSLQELKKLKNMKLTTNTLPTKSVGADKARPVEEYDNLIGRKLFEVSDGNKTIKLIADDKTQALELAKQQGLKGTEAKILHRVKDLDEAKKYAVPDMTQYGRTSDTASTMVNAQILENAPDPTKAREAVKESVERGDYYKDVIPNHTRYELGQLKKGVVEKAQTRIDTDLDNAIKDLDAAARTGKGTSQDVALGYKLAEKLSSEGRYDELSEVLANTSAILSEAGRTLQAAKLFATLTKDDKALTITRQIERLRSKYPDVSIKVDQSMIDDVVNAATTKEEYASREALFTHVWNQIPPTWQEKVDAWRHLAMLGNPKTHMRNIVGNALFVVPRTVSDTIGAGLEKALIKSGAFEKAMANVKNADEIYRTKAGIFRQVEPDIKKAAKASFDDKADMLMSGSSKYIEQARPQGSDVFWTLKNGKRKQTKLGEIVDKLAKANGLALEKEDRKFMGIAYRKAFSDYCFANDIKPSELTDDVLEKVEAYATQQCLEATYRNRNDIAKVLSRCRKQLATVNKDDSQAIKAGKKIGLLVMDSAIPYIKTPANIIAKGIEYSPVGNLMGIYKMMKATNPQEFLRGIEYLAEGITGTGMMTLGVYLAHSGKLNGAIAVEDNKYYKQDIGQQSYALTIGDRSITVDWAVPAALSVLTGVSIYENMKASLLTSEEDGLSKLNSMVNVVIDSLSTLPEPIMELSMLQGVENVLKQGFSSEDKTISSIATNMITNYVTQFVPTFGGQIARTTTPERHETTVLGKEGTSKTVEKTARKILNKIPGAINLTEEYINVWGKTEANGSDNVFYRAIYQMLSPAYISKDKSTPVDEELLRLDKSIGSQIDGTVIPSWNATSESKITVNDTEYQMTNEEYTKYKKTVGQAKFSGLQELMTTKEYKKASDTDKAKMVKEVYQKAKDKGVREYVESLGGDVLRSYVVSQLTPTQQKAVGKTISLKNAEKILKAKEQIGGNASHVAQAYYMDLPTKILKKLGISDTSIDKAKTLKNAGVDYNKMQKEMTSNSKYDYNGDGKLGNTGEVLAYLSTKNWSNEKKWAYLYANTGVKSTSKSKYMSQF